MNADLILFNGQFHTVDRENPRATAVAIRQGRFVAVGTDGEAMALRGSATQVIDLKGRTVIPGLNDSHLHLIRGGLNYNLELRWEGVPSLADALRMLKDQADRTPTPQWVRVVGGWNEFQFAEKRMPTLEELNQAAPDTPVFVLHLYDRALLNRAALRVAGYTKDTPNPPGGEIVRDSNGNPTGMLVARPNAMILYSTLAKGPKLPLEYQVNSTRQFMRELNRLGLTSAIDAGGGFQNYPGDYAVVEQLAREGQLTLQPLHAKPGQGDDWYRHNGAGEMLVFSAADFEDFLEPRPELAAGMEGELEAVVRHLVSERWPFRLHATYDESISRMLDVFEKVDREIPFNGLRWMFDHAETISPRNIDRVRALGGGIAIQHRMAFQGEYFVDRYGADAARQTPPIKRMLDAGVPVGAGTDATRVASYNPWTALYWLVSGKTVGGLHLYDAGARLSRETAIELWTSGSAWFSSEQSKKGRIAVGMLADLAVLSADFFTIDEDAIKAIESVLTIVGGRIVYGQAEFSTLGPPPIPVLPDWSPAAHGGHYRPASLPHQCQGPCGVHAHQHGTARRSGIRVSNHAGFWGALGCSCFAFSHGDWRSPPVTALRRRRLHHPLHPQQSHPGTGSECQSLPIHPPAVVKRGKPGQASGASPHADEARDWHLLPVPGINTPAIGPSTRQQMPETRLNPPRMQFAGDLLQARFMQQHAPLRPRQARRRLDAASDTLLAPQLPQRPLERGGRDALQTFQKAQLGADGRRHLQRRIVRKRGPHAGVDEGGPLAVGLPSGRQFHHGGQAAIGGIELEGIGQAGALQQAREFGDAPGRLGLAQGQPELKAVAGNADRGRRQLVAVAQGVGGVAQGAPLLLAASRSAGGKIQHDGAAQSSRRVQRQRDRAHAQQMLLQAAGAERQGRVAVAAFKALLLVQQVQAAQFDYQFLHG